jgi:hypothetical protein
MVGLSSLLVFIASFSNPQAHWKLKKFDYICGVCSLLALVLWRITQEPLVAIIFSIASDGLAALPTITKSRKHPQTESVEAYITGLFCSLTSFFALKTFGISEFAFPIYLVILYSLLIIIVYKGRLKKIFSR